MTKYQRLTDVLDRQQKYRVLDAAVAMVLVLGLAVAAITVVMQMGQVPSSPEVFELAAATDATTYTAELLDRAATDLVQ